MLGTALVTAFIIYKTKGMQGNYNVEATLYTGVVSGYGIEENNAGVNWAIAQNAIDNIINIIESEIKELVNRCRKSSQQDQCI